ncbi:MAG: hypothetical protein ABSF64_11260 [Bryobacteraceae bacterium]
MPSDPTRSRRVSPATPVCASPWSAISRLPAKSKARPSGTVRWTEVAAQLSHIDAPPPATVPIVPLVAILRTRPIVRPRPPLLTPM